MRLDKFLSVTGTLSRSESKKAIRAGRLRIDGAIAKSGETQLDPEAQKVRDAGGLFILGTERHESRRIDNQLRGRSGRQGDPGESRFFISLEDDLMRLFGSERIIGLVDRLGLPDDTPIDAKILSNQIDNAQKRIEDQNFKRRKYVFTSTSHSANGGYHLDTFFSKMRN